MKFIKLSFLFFMAAIILNGCVKEDIDNLQKQINDLDEKLSKYEEDQQAALLAEIAKLEASILAMNGDFDTLLAQLQELEETVEYNSSMVFYGNVLTNEDYTNLKNSGASIVSGKVVVSKSEHVEMMNAVTMIGNELEVVGGSELSFNTIQHINGALIINDISVEDSEVSFTELISVGNGVYITDNPSLTSFSADKLVYIESGYMCSNNLYLTTLLTPVLDVVGGNLVIDNKDKWYQSKLINLDLSYANVRGNVNLTSLGNEEQKDDRVTVTLGEVGDLTIFASFLKLLDYSGSKMGSLSLNEIYFFEEIKCNNLELIDGDFTISDNNNGIGSSIGGSTGGDNAAFELSAFDKLTFINGDVYIRNNKFDSYEGLNAVSEIGGSKIECNSNGNDNPVVSIFNSLKKSSDIHNQRYNIIISEKTAWFHGFSVLDGANSINISFRTPVSTTDCILSGFDELLEVQSTIQMDLNDVTEFNAFPNLAAFGYSGNYLEMVMPSDHDVTLCSMSDLLNRILAGEFDKDYNPSYKASFYHLDYADELPRETAIPILVADCQ